MGFLNMISNRHLLVGLVGLGALNAVLCLMYMMRERSNATEIVKLADDLKLASDKHHSREKFLADELVKTRDDLNQVKRSLSQTAEKLDVAQTTIERMRTTLATYQNLDGRLSLVEKTLRDKKLVPSETKGK